MNQVLLYVASAMTASWGVAHLCATKGVVRGFGDITADNRRIITMEWIVEGVTMISISAFVVAATANRSDTTISLAIYTVAIATLIVLAVVSLFTGFGVGFLPFKLCPVILGSSAALIAFGAWL